MRIEFRRLRIQDVSREIDHVVANHDECVGTHLAV
jgi:hypothetical protein